MKIQTHSSPVAQGTVKNSGVNILLPMNKRLWNKTCNHSMALHSKACRPTQARLRGLIPPYERLACCSILVL